MSAYKLMQLLLAIPRCLADMMNHFWANGYYLRHTLTIMLFYRCQYLAVLSGLLWSSSIMADSEDWFTSVANQATMPYVAIQDDYTLITDLAADIKFEYGARLTPVARYFFHPGWLGQLAQQVAILLEPEWHWQLDDCTLRSQLFGHYEPNDSSSNKLDIRELLWTCFDDEQVWSVGIGKVFRGVNESQNLLDIVNQRDNLMWPSKDEKLGQPMFHYTHFANNSSFEIYLLPYFRPLTFMDGKSRLRPSIDISLINQFASSHGQRNLDWAGYWTRNWDNLELSLGYFNGTRRMPILEPVVTTSGLLLQPYYPQIRQWGLMAQFIERGWIWKLEGIYQQGWRENSDYWAFTGGFEYGWSYGFNLDYFLEYQYDQRSALDTVSQNDLFMGIRFNFNDIYNTELIWTVLQDLELKSQQRMSVKLSSKLYDATKATLGLHTFRGTDKQSIDYFLARDDFAEFKLEHYF